MPRKFIYCCAGGCGYNRKASGEPDAANPAHPGDWKMMHRFPKNAQLCISWLRACGNNELLTQPPTVLHGNKYYVCQDHFLRADYVHARSLGPHCVPSIFNHNRPLSRAVIEDYCNRNNVAIPLDLPDDLDHSVELVPLMDHAYSLPGGEARINVQASNDEMAVEVEENEVNLEASFNAGSVHCTESLQNTGFEDSQEEEVVEVECISDDFLFNDDFACISGQETAAVQQDNSIHVNLLDHDYTSFSAGDGNNEKTFLQEPAEETFQDSLEPLVQTPERVVFDCNFVTNNDLLEEQTPGPSGVRCQINDSPDCVVAHSATKSDAIDQLAAGPSGEEDVVRPDRNPFNNSSGSNTPAELSSGEPNKKTRRCRRSLHKDFNIKRKEVTPRKAALWKEVKELRKKNKELSKKYEELQSQYKSSRTTKTDVILSSLKDKVSTGLYMCLKGELMNLAKDPHGKRWSFDFKCFALAIFKLSPKTYRFLRGMFNLPAESVLRDVLYSIPFKTGFNPAVANKLKHDIPLMEALDTYVTMSCDEMALRKGLYYDEKKDVVHGFVDYGSGRTTGAVADHALQFMINWLRKPLKEAVSTYFTRGTCPTDVLKILIPENIACLQALGIYVKIYTCDQGSTNRAAVRKLIEESGGTEDNSFIVNGVKIFAIFDPPHLLKNFRNNFMTADVHFENGKIAKWEHIQTLHKLQSNSNLRCSSKLTDAHINPNNRQKMRVFRAAQVLSKSVESGLRTVSFWPGGAGTPNCSDTADLVGKMDTIWDSVNGYAEKPDPNKLYRCPLTSVSPHLAFYPEAKEWMDSIQFKDKNNKTRRPPCQDGWVRLLESIPNVWRELAALGFESLNLRDLDQDVVENLFGCVRQVCGDNTNPTTLQYEGALKTVMLNKFSTRGVRGKNCEDDDSYFLSSLKAMLSADTSVMEGLAGVVSRDLSVFPVSTPGGTRRLDHQSDTEEDSLTDYLRRNSTMHVAGQVTKKLLTGCSCSACCSTLSTTEITSDHAFLLLQEYDPNAPVSTYEYIPSSNMAKTVIAVQGIFHRDIVPSLNLPKPCKRLKETSLLEVDFSWLCSEHADMIKDNFFKYFCSALLHSECTYRNHGAMWRYLNKASANQMQKFFGC